MNIFETTSVLNRTIRLTDVQWNHIRERHPEMEDQQDKLRETLENPDFVVHSVRDDTYHYVRKYAETPVSEKHALVVVKHLDRDGFVITAFFVSRIRKEGKVVVYGKEAYDQL